MKVTIKDISRVSGYSSSTVSRVLTNQGNVSEETRKDILKSVSDLNYRPYLYNYIDNKEHYPIVMIIVADITNYFYAGLINSMTKTLSQYNYKTMITNSNVSNTLEEEYLKYAQDHGYAGVIMITAIETDNLIKLINKKICPVVLVNRYIKSMDLDVVCIDNFRGGYMAAEYLLDLGHQKICHLAGPRVSSASQERTRGFLDAMKDTGRDFLKDDIFYGDLTYESGYKFGKTIIKNKLYYTAIFCGNDLMARGFADALDEENVRIPDDISLICFDNSPAAVSGKTKFTTIYREPDLIGTAVANLMMECINDKNREPVKMIYPPHLLVRDSCRRIQPESVISEAMKGK